MQNTALTLTQIIFQRFSITSKGTRVKTLTGAVITVLLLLAEKHFIPISINRLKKWDEIANRDELVMGRSSLNAKSYRQNLS